MSTFLSTMLVWAHAVHLSHSDTAVMLLTFTAACLQPCLPLSCFVLAGGSHGVAVDSAVSAQEDESSKHMQSALHVCPFLQRH